MSNLFSGLESFGLGKLKKLDIYDQPEKQDEVPLKSEKPQELEGDYVFDKTYTCPVCDSEFKTKMVKTGRVKLISADSDLRPKYHMVDSLKYDAIVCPVCGYAALNRFFNYVTNNQTKSIKENISVSFKGLEAAGEFFTYDNAITRHKLALVNAIVKKGKNSEKAYTCLKIAWLCRGKAENLSKETEQYDTVISGLEKDETEFLVNAYDGFLNAFSKEAFPMCGMDEITMTYMIAELARRVGKYEESSRWISKVLISREANRRIKEKAIELKEMLREVQGKE